MKAGSCVNRSQFVIGTHFLPSGAAARFSRTAKSPRGQAVDQSPSVPEEGEKTWRPSPRDNLLPADPQFPDFCRQILVRFDKHGLFWLADTESMIEPPTAGGRIARILFQVKRRVDIAQFDPNHLSKRYARQKPREPHSVEGRARPTHLSSGSQQATLKGL
jgi:hypothetical protein